MSCILSSLFIFILLLVSSTSSVSESSPSQLLPYCLVFPAFKSAAGPFTHDCWNVPVHLNYAPFLGKAFLHFWHFINLLNRMLFSGGHNLLSQGNRCNNTIAGSPRTILLVLIIFSWWSSVFLIKQFITFFFAKEYQSPLPVSVARTRSKGGTFPSGPFFSIWILCLYVFVFLYNHVWFGPDGCTANESRLKARPSFQRQNFILVTQMKCSCIRYVKFHREVKAFSRTHIQYPGMGPRKRFSPYAEFVTFLSPLGLLSSTCKHSIIVWSIIYYYYL